MLKFIRALFPNQVVSFSITLPMVDEAPPAYIRSLWTEVFGIRTKPFHVTYRVKLKVPKDTLSQTQIQNMVSRIYEDMAREALDVPDHD